MAERSRSGQRGPRGARGKPKRVIVVGAGLAGMASVLGLCQRGVPVLWLSTTQPHASHSVCDREGIAHPQEVDAHLGKTLAHARGLADPRSVRALLESSSSSVELLARLGVPFHRDEHGALGRAPAGSQVRRAGGLTGHYVIAALERALLPYESQDVVDAVGATVPGERLLERRTPWELLSLVLDDNGVAVGVVAQDLRSLKIRHFVADAVIAATGSAARLFSPTTASPSCNGAAVATLVRQGAVLANAELVHVHPTCLLGKHKAFAMPEALREHGARLWVPREPKDTRVPSEIPDRERDYFLERLFPEDGNCAPAALATRALLELRASEKSLFSAVSGRFEPAAYLDATHLPQRVHDDYLLDLVDPFPGAATLASRALKVGPAATTTLGGLWVDLAFGTEGRVDRSSARNHATNLPGLYAAGQACFAYHGAGLVMGNAGLADIFGGLLAAEAVIVYHGALERTAHDLPGSVFEAAAETEQARFDSLLAANASEPTTSARTLSGTLGKVVFDALLSSEPEPTKIDMLREQLTHVRVQSVELARSAVALRRLQLGMDLAEWMVLAAHRRARMSAGSPRLTLARVRAGGTDWLDEFSYSCAGRSVHVTDAVHTEQAANASKAS